MTELVHKISMIAEPFRRLWTTPTAWQLLTVGILGLVLGLYVVNASSLAVEWMVLLIVAVISPFVALVVGDVRRFLLGVILLESPVQLDIHLNCREELDRLGALCGLNVSLTTFALIALYVLWIVRFLTKNERPLYSFFVTSLPPFAFLVASTLSILVAQNATFSLFEILLLLQTFLLYFYVVNTVRTRQDVLFVVTLLSLGLVLESLLMSGLRIVGHSIEFAGVLARVDNGSRVGGTVGSPNGAAAYLSLLVVPALSLLIARLRRRHRYLGLLGFGLGGIALILTFSRGGWVAFVVSFAIFCFLVWYRGQLPSSVLLTIIGVSLLLFVFYGDDIAARLLRDDNRAAYSRIPLARLAFQIIRDHPLQGIGVNNTVAVLPQYVTPEFSREWIYNIHNKYLLVWVETGLIGLMTFLWFLAATLRRGWQCWQRRDPLLSPIALGFTAAIMGHMFHMLVDIFNDRPHVQLLWLIAALITAMNMIVKGKGESAVVQCSIASRVTEQGEGLAQRP